MKNLILFSFLFCSIFSFAQNNVTVFSEDGYPFYLILNGVRQNENPETNIRLEKLSQEMFTAKVIFADQTLMPIEKKFFLVANDECRPCDVTYKVKTNKKGDLVMKVFAFTPLQMAPPPAPNVAVVQYNTRPMPAIGTTVQVTETTTTTTSGNTGGDHVGVDVNIGGVGFNMDVSVNDPHVESHSTTTTTTVTSTSYEAVNAYTEPVLDCTMSSSDYNAAVNSIRSKDWEDSKLEVAKQVATNNCLTADQVKNIMQLFEWEDSRLTFAKHAYSNCVDQNNYFKVNDAFEWEDSIEELNSYIK